MQLLADSNSTHLPSLPNELIFDIVTKSVTSCLADYLENNSQRTMSRQLKNTVLSIARASPHLHEHVHHVLQELYAYCCEERYQRRRRYQAHRCQRGFASRRVFFQAPKWCGEGMKLRNDLHKMSEAYTCVYQLCTSLDRMRPEGLLAPRERTSTSDSSDDLFD